MKNKSIKVVTAITLMMILFSLATPVITHASGEGFWKGFDVKVSDKDVTTGVKEGSGFDELIENLKVFIVGIAGVATVVAVGFFIMNFMKLGGSNARSRSEAISGLIYSGVATAGLGSVTLIAAMFYGMIGKG